MISAVLDMQIPFKQMFLPDFDSKLLIAVGSFFFFFYYCGALGCPCSCELSKYWGFGVLILHYIKVVVLNLAQVGCCRDHPDLVCVCEELLKLRHTGSMKYRHL